MKRSLIILIHIFAVLLLVAGLSILYAASPNGYGLSWTRQERYEDTPQFAQRMNEDIAAIHELAALRDVFEEDGALAQDAAVAEMEVDGDYKTLSLRDAVQTAQKYGCYLDPNTHELTISDTENTDQNNYELRILYKYYDPDYIDSIPVGPGIGVTTIRELSVDVMRNLARYYRLREQYLEAHGNLYFSMTYQNVYGEISDFSNTEQLSETLLSFGKYVYVDEGTQSVKTNVDPLPEAALMQEAQDGEGNEEYLFLAAVDTDYPYQDAYQKAARRFEGDIRTAYLAIGMLVLGGVSGLASFVMLVRFDGYPDREAAMRLRPADRLPLELYLLLCVIFAACGCFLMSATGYKAAKILTPEGQWYYWQKLLNLLVIYGVSLFALLGIIRRAAKGGFFRNTVMHGLIADLNEYAANQRLSGALCIRYSALIFGNLLAFLGMIWFYLHREESGLYLTAFAVLLLALCGEDFAVFRRLYVSARQQDRLNEALLHISEGNTDYPVNESEYSGREKVIAKRLNHISTGIRTALSEQVKSERLKADLITNVSHDIRTPLTSIINYVDLLKRENISDPKIREYIEVLDRKSARLKNLTEDLLEASKASSGNIKMEMQRIDFVELSIQAGAEFEEKFAAKGLELCLSAPEHSVSVRADGRHLWRVLENLYNNAAKYSLPNTRVYAEVKTEGREAVFTIKNISAAKLNISPDELTERFVRGDLSRSTEGSGLGLNIAKSLTVLQGGRLEIAIDGDLYKACVIFPLEAEEKPGKRPEEAAAEA